MPSLPVQLSQLPGATAIPSSSATAPPTRVPRSTARTHGWYVAELWRMEKEDDTAVCTVVRSVFSTVHQEGGRVDRPLGDKQERSAARAIPWTVVEGERREAARDRAAGPSPRYEAALLGSVKSVSTTSFKFMRLLRIPEPFDHPDWIVELKMDGVACRAPRRRCEVVFRSSGVQCWSQLSFIE